ncbi:endothelin-1 [Anolis carolinensis]|uniref:Endothelin-1 n=1 Tax=Anolis carolinensis TaxID=28377 RepID=H9GDX1_ANOCA|nr:PREDICTED: endothelin-1 [Anolis carolinensis]|eukprot:XP_003223609.1 PREDICTED: endothelin-1 [Anolis carolinensis]
MDYARLILPLLMVLSQGVPQADAVELGTSGNAEKRPSGALSPLRRAKRCSCSSLMDKECVYFCHLDIIWINTPERTVPYGLGSASRIRRSLEDLPLRSLQGSPNRCQCTNLKDKKCANFCKAEKEIWTQSTTEKGWEYLLKNRDCKGLGCAFRQLANSKKMRRLDTISNSIKASFNIAKLKSRLHKPKQLKHNRTYKKQNVWESLKTTS